MASIPHITVLGSLNMDLVAYVPHRPLPGETLTADRFATSPGGKGANQAVASKLAISQGAKLSRPRPSSSGGATTTSSSPTAHVSMVGSVGSDAHGAQLRANLTSYGVDVSGVVDAPSGTGTGVAMIIVDKPTGENRIVLSPGANHAVQPGQGQDAEEWVLRRLRVDDVPTDAPTNYEEGVTAHSVLPDMLIMQLEIPLQTVLVALAAARKKGVEVLLNPAPASPLPEEAYVGLAHLVVNETEAAILGGLGVGNANALAGDEAALERVSRGFLARGVRNVVITLGGKGVYYMSSAGGLSAEEVNVDKKGLVPAEKAKVVDTTAAGDTFVGRYALEAAVARKKGEVFDIEKAVREANRAAAKTVERPGAQDSIPWRDELE
ncbi:hypothetical protein VTJ49DRAFT_1963 [Mycothermus thermophilus]|uniref:Ribokinase n=1 Tax=Humicola insolens TaxID=85995 RepID=A0ABR3VR14_HUMIN